MLAHIRFLRILFLISLRDFFAMYSLRLYLIAWFPRIAAQVIFFTLLANFVGGRDFLEYALVGNAVYLLTATSIVFVTASVNWERRGGTLPLIISSPGSLLFVLSGRNLGMGLHGYLTGVIGIFVIGPLLGLAFGIVEIVVVLLLLMLVAFSSYCIGLVTGSFAVRTRGFHNVLSNLLILTMASVCGVNFPLEILPDWIRVIGNLLPLTHGLQAIRLLLAGEAFSIILPEIIYEFLLGLTYLILGLISFKLLLESSRKHGSFDLEGSQ
jgi:ABC-2 type transport system permease protein